MTFKDYIKLKDRARDSGVADHPALTRLLHLIQAKQKAKEALLESTNIETSPKEMEVLDSFLFRCWQMGWLNKYDKAGEQE